MTALRSPAGSTGPPTPLSSFVGRGWEIRKAIDALGAARLVTLTGTGGCGKTRLALEVAARAAEGFADGVLWIELAPLAGPGGVAKELARSVDARSSRARTDVEAVSGLLCERSALVVLDNCEHVVEESAAVVHAVLRACPNVKVLATSRVPLGVAGEHEWRVPSLGLPQPDGPAGDSDALRLFAERARLVRHDFVLCNRTLPATVEICRRLDGIPLAIELAAARLRLLSPQQLAAGLDDALMVIAGRDRDVAPRQRTMRASIQWSHALLDPQAALLLRRLGVFAGDFNLDLATATCCDEALPAAAVLDVLGELVEHSLVHVIDAGAEARYRLLEVVRQYALAQVEAAGERAELEDRHARALVALALELEPQLLSERQPEVLARLDAERPNLEAALRRLEVVDPDAGMRLCTALFVWWRARGHFAEGAEALERALSAADSAPSVLRARALAVWGYMLGSWGDPGAGLAAADEALKMAEEIADHTAMADALLVTANLRAFNGTAGPVLDRCMALAEELDDDWVRLRCDLYRAMACWAQQHTHAGLELLTRQRERAVRVAERRTLAIALTVDGCLRHPCLDHGVAAERHAEAIALAREAADPLAELGSQLSLALLDVNAGRWEAARASLRQLRARMLPSGGAAYLGWAIVYEALAEATGGDLAAARDLLERVPGGAPYHHNVWARVELAEVLRATGDPSARARADEALAAASALGNDWLTAKALLTLARLDAVDEEWSRGERRCHEALAAVEARETWLELSHTLETLAIIADGSGDPQRAARLLGAAERFRSARGPVAWPAHRAEIASVCARLPADDAPEATVEEIIAWLQRGHGERRRPARGWDSLTPTERDVAVHAAAGLTNPQIGKRLFISRSTVKRHLGRVFAKLGVASRTELAQFVARRRPD